MEERSAITPAAMGELIASQIKISKPFLECINPLEGSFKFMIGNCVLQILETRISGIRAVLIEAGCVDLASGSKLRLITAKGTSIAPWSRVTLNTFGPETDAIVRASLAA